MPSPSDAAVVSFGPFVFDRTRKTLLREGQAVRLGGRAMDLLDTLVGSAGEVLSRDRLVARVWPRAVVEETSLRVHV
ncbi:MAG: winged helix-turn-helix domain-containing protein, partial [Rhizobacter sp.]